MSSKPQDEFSNQHSEKLNEVNEFKDTEIISEAEAAEKNKSEALNTNKEEESTSVSEGAKAARDSAEIKEFKDSKGLKEGKDAKNSKDTKSGARTGKKEHRKLTSLITNNFWMKVISLVFAILIWSYVINETNPARSAVFSDLNLSVNYEYSLRNSGLVLQNDITRLPKIRVTMDIPYKEYRNVKASNITVYIDLSQITATGTYDLPVSASCSNSEALITSISPSTVRVVVDDLATAEIPVVPSYTGTLPSNLYMQSQAVISPSVLEVSGPANYVSRIAAARVDIDLAAMTDGYSASLPYTFIDSQGETISSDNIEVENNRSSVLVEMGIVTKKTVPIEYMSHLLNTDKLAEGYEFESAELRQDTVEIIGSAENLANIDSLHIEDIDMSGMDGSIKQINANLVVPDGITVLNPSPAILDITIGEQEISRQFNVDIQYQNVPAGANYTTSATQAQVVFSGNYFNINSIEESDVQIIIDLSGLALGTHTLQTDTWLVTDARGISIESIRSQHYHCNNLLAYIAAFIRPHKLRLKGVRSLLKGGRRGARPPAGPSQQCNKM